MRILFIWGLLPLRESLSITPIGTAGYRYKPNVRPIYLEDYLQMMPAAGWSLQLTEHLVGKLSLQQDLRGSPSLLRADYVCSSNSSKIFNSNFRQYRSRSTELERRMSAFVRSRCSYWFRYVLRAVKGHIEVFPKPFSRTIISSNRHTDINFQFLCYNKRQVARIPNCTRHHMEVTVEVPMHLHMLRATSIELQLNMKV